jgi:hypothetical protein
MEYPTNKEVVRQGRNALDIGPIDLKESNVASCRFLR